MHISKKRLQKKITNLKRLCYNVYEDCRYSRFLLHRNLSEFVNKEENMTKKKSIWAVILALMLFVPTMFLFSACGKHKHSFSSDWSKSETQHWHDCTDKNCNEKQDLADHDFVWTEKTPAGVHTDKVETGTCSTCQYQKDRTIEGSGANIHSWEWKTNNAKHWQETTCEQGTPLKQNEQDHTWESKSDATKHWEQTTCTQHETIKRNEEAHTWEWKTNNAKHWQETTCEQGTPLKQNEQDHTWESKSDATKHWEQTTCTQHETIKRNEEAHTWEWKTNNAKHWQETTCEQGTPLKQNEENHIWVYTPEDEFTHQRQTDCGSEKHTQRTESGLAHTYTDEKDVDCNDCGYVRSLAGKGSFNALTAKTYNAGAQGVASSDYTVDEAIKGLCEIQYKVKDADDSTYTTTAPTNAGTYEVRIFCQGNETYLQGEVAKTELRIKGAFVWVNNQYPLKDNGGSSLYIDLVNVTASGGSLSQSRKLTLRVIKSNAEEFSGIGRHQIAYGNDKLVFVDADLPGKPVNKNYIPTFNNFDAATIFLLRYSTENTTIKMKTPSTANVEYTSNLVTFKGIKVETGFIKRGDYVTFDNYTTLIRVGDITYHNYLVEGDETNPYSIKFETGGKSKEYWEGLVDKTFTKIETLIFEEGKNYTNTVSRELKKGESFCLAFATETSPKTYQLEFDTIGTGYATNDSVAFFKKDGTGVSGGYRLNLGASEKEGVYFVKVTKVADSEPGKESVDFYIKKW